MARLGTTNVLTYTSEIEAVHIALLHTGKVLYYSGFRRPEGMSTETRVWNPETDRITKHATPEDIFCAGHSFLPDGRLLSTGGTKYRNLPSKWLVKLLAPLAGKIPLFLQRLLQPIAMRGWEFTGPTYLYLFDPEAEKWTKVGDMEMGRWYPTNTTLPDGRILLTSGTDQGLVEADSHDDGNDHSHAPAPEKTRNVKLNMSLEVFYAKGKQTKLEKVAMIPGGKDGWPSFPTLYPRTHVLPVSGAEEGEYPSGRVFCSGYGPETKMLNLHTWKWKDIDNLRMGPIRYDCCSVLLPLMPPDYRARVLVFGGSPEGALNAEAIDTVEIIDFGTPSPKWELLRNDSGNTVRIMPRVNGASVLLPNGNVMAVGGNSSGRFHKSVHEIEIFDSTSQRWDHNHEPLKVGRGYHASAILLPDARVLVSGTTPVGRQEFSMEVYSPYYLDGDPSRPVIEHVDSEINYDESFEVKIAEGSTVKRAALMRPGAMTHAFDMDQRHIWMEILEDTGNTLELRAPKDNHVAPPGYYMLFLLNENGVPSRAEFVRLPVI